MLSELLGLAIVVRDFLREPFKGPQQLVDDANRRFDEQYKNRLDSQGFERTWADYFYDIP